jgi:hypothetical protein
MTTTASLAVSSASSAISDPQPAVESGLSARDPNCGKKTTRLATDLYRRSIEVHGKNAGMVHAKGDQGANGDRKRMSLDENNSSTGAEAGIWQYLNENFADPIRQLDAWVDCVTARRAANSLIDPGAKSARPAASPPEKQADHLKHLTGLCRRAGICQAGILADTLMLLTEGVRNVGESNHSEPVRRKLNRICKATIAAFSQR